MSEEKTLQTVMVIGAHPDDPEFGCAATIAKWAAQGRQIDYVLLTSGDKGSHDPTQRPGEVAALREVEQRAAAEALGVRSVKFLHYPDGTLENTLDLRRHLCGLIRRRKPNIVVTIDPWRRYQLHPDHRAAGMAALDAIYAAREWYIFPEQLINDEPWRVSEIYLFWTDQPDYWEDVTESIDLRIRALLHHDSQVNGRTETLGQRIREGAQKTGEAHGYAYAEAFKLIKL
ncbi:MAG: PIG-L family deacetylase [Chloroflexi bacterium]|jgi:LmbE family N-acetylglucosaminyl deacetylase|nr:PIG-L family deacetylase [Chloroflexota bacterium]